MNIVAKNLNYNLQKEVQSREKGRQIAPFSSGNSGSRTPSEI